MRATILTIGNEILKGKTVNTNMAHIGRVLTYAGYEVSRAIVVKDDSAEIEWGIKTSLSDSDLVVTSGGLGPTFDDMTMESISLALNLETEINQEAYEKLASRYKDRKIELTPERLKMVKLPRGAKALQNPVGVAPGALIEFKGKRIVILPGVPKEMEAILEAVIDSLKVKNRTYHEETLTLEGIMESSLAPLLSRIMKEWAGKVYIKSHPKHSEVANPVLEIDISSSDPEESVAKENVKGVIREILDSYKTYIGR